MADNHENEEDHVEAALGSTADPNETGNKPSSLQSPPQNAMEAILGQPYASPTPPFTYLVETVLIIIQSAALSLFSLGYLNVAFEVPKLWLSMQGNDAYPDDPAAGSYPATTTFLSGNPAWIGIGALTGVIVGTLKGYIFRFDDYNGFVDDLLTLEIGVRSSRKCKGCHHLPDQLDGRGECRSREWIGQCLWRYEQTLGHRRE